MTDISYPTPDYLSLPCQPEHWLIEGIVTIGGAFSMFGAPKVGKSYLALQLAGAVAGEADQWMDFNVKSTGLVLYVQLDMPRSLWQREHLTIMRHAGYTLESVLHMDRQTLGEAWPLNIFDDEAQDLLAGEVALYQPSLVIIDTLRRVFRGDENDSDTMQRALDTLQKTVAPAALGVVGHSKKPNMDTGSDVIHDQRGSTAVPGAVDTLIQCRKRSLGLAGRAIEEQIIKTERTPYLWQRREVDLDAHIKVVLEDHALTSLRERARALAERTGRTEEACRSLLRRKR